MDTLERADLVLARLRARHGTRYSFRAGGTPFQFLVAAILSAQEMESVVDRVAPRLFEDHPTPQAMMRADLGRLREILAPLRFAWTKAEWIREVARLLVERHDGRVPRELHALTALPGVGPRTASVVQGRVWGEAHTVAVDAHVKRVAYRLAFTSDADDADVAEDELVATFAQDDWPDLGFYLARHGRATCVALRPRCGECPIEDLCPKVDVTAISEAARGLASVRTPPGWREGASPRRA